METNQKSTSTSSQTGLCHCGKPLHYTDPATRALIEELVLNFGPDVRVRDAEGRWWLIQRHYIALHGIKEREIASLGFPEITEQIRDEFEGRFRVNL